MNKPIKPSVDNSEKISQVLSEASKKIKYLIKKLIVKEVLTGEDIEEKINLYMKEHRESLLEFLGEEGKVLIVMDSAEKFGDFIIERLGIPEERVVKIRVQTYKDGKSSVKELSAETQTNLSNSLSSSSKVLVLEDMIDTGNTFSLLYRYFRNKNFKDQDLKMLSLFDKNVEASEGIKRELGDILSSIIDIGNEFIIGYGMDYSHRLFADLEGLYSVTNIEEFLKIANTYKNRIEAIILGNDSKK